MTANVLNWEYPNRPRYLPDICNKIIRDRRSMGRRTPLRKLYYKLLSRGLTNNEPAYNKLSRRTAEWRRQGIMDDLVDLTRSIYDMESWDTMSEAVEDRVAEFRMDRDRTQEELLMIGVEKNELREDFLEWYGDPYGIPILPFGGYMSQSFVDQVARFIKRDGRKPTLLYGGDHDEHGGYIQAEGERRLLQALGKIHYRGAARLSVQRVALTAAQIDYLGPNGGPMIRTFGNSDNQVEIDQLDEPVVKGLFDQAVEDFGFDFEAVDRIVAKEDRVRAAMQVTLAAETDYDPYDLES